MWKCMPKKEKSTAVWGVHAVNNQYRIKYKIILLNRLKMCVGKTS